MSDTKPAAQLKPCPFCSESKWLHIPVGEMSKYVECDSCHAQVCPGHKATKAEAITAWNTRPASDLREVLSDFDKQLAESEMPNVYEKGALVILERIINEKLKVKHGRI